MIQLVTQRDFSFFTEIGAIFRHFFTKLLSKRVLEKNFVKKEYRKKYCRIFSIQPLA